MHDVCGFSFDNSMPEIQATWYLLVIAWHCYYISKNKQRSLSIGCIGRTWFEHCRKFPGRETDLNNTNLRISLLFFSSRIQRFSFVLWLLALNELVETNTLTSCICILLACTSWSVLKKKPHWFRSVLNKVYDLFLIQINLCLSDSLML